MTLDTMSNILRQAKAPGIGNRGFLICRSHCRREPDGPVREEDLYPASGIVHPGTPEMRRLLPEEYRQEEYIVIYTDENLSTGADHGGRLYFPADEISMDGNRFLVVWVKHWPHAGYCQALAVRQL